jgi:hypothetical protein
VALSLINTHWADGVILTGAALRNEFNNLYNNPMSLISPATGDLQMGGNKVTGLSLGSVAAAGLSATGNAGTGVYFSSVNVLDIAANSVRALSVGSATNGVNYLQILPAQTTANVSLNAQGSDTNPGIDIITKGSGSISFKRAAGSTTDGQMASGLFLWGTAATTGANTGDFVLKNTGALRFIIGSGGTSANYNIHGTADNNMEFETPGAGDARFNWYTNNTIRMSFRTENAGMGLFFNAASTTDHAAPGSAGQGVIYLVDIGGGKSAFKARFASGAVQTVATEP